MLLLILRYTTICKLGSLQGYEKKRKMNEFLAEMEQRETAVARNSEVARDFRGADSGAASDQPIVILVAVAIISFNSGQRLNSLPFLLFHLFFSLFFILFFFISSFHFFFIPSFWAADPKGTMS